MVSGKRTVRVEGDIAYVPLTRGYEAIIDVEAVPLVASWNWTACVVMRSDGTVSSVYARRMAWVCSRHRSVLLHRVIIGDIGDMEVDHIDGDGLNNRRINLRAVTREENSYNRRGWGASGIKGVRFDQARQKWRASIKGQGKSVFLGRFETRDDAISAYLRASADLHGEFRRTS